MEFFKRYGFFAIVFCSAHFWASERDVTYLRQKMVQAEELAKEGEQLLRANPLSTACRLFETQPTWHASDLTISVFGLYEGAAICYLDGEDTLLIWDVIGASEKTKDVDVSRMALLDKNRAISPNLQDKDSKSYVIDEMRSQGHVGGWISYEWNGSVRFSYVKTIQKDDEELVLGVSFYPDSPQFIIQQLVKQAVWYGQKYGAQQLFQQINNPQGPFVIGDMYLWVYDMEGFAFAHGRNLAYVGQNRIDWKDPDGRARNRIMIDFVSRESKGWVDYNEGGVAKRAYVQELVDPRTGKRYVVGGGYYPKLSADTVRDMVKQGEAYLKAHGTEIAFRDFTSFVGQFSKGPLHMFAYDLNGISRADGENPIFIGQNLSNMQTPDGRFLVREIIDTAVNNGSGWINFVNKRAFYSVFVQYVEVPDGKFVIGSGYWPVAKESYASLLADNAVRYLNNNDTFMAFKEFCMNRRDFMYGDLFIQVYAEDGTCLVYGADKYKIWEDVSNELDELGYPFVNRVIAQAKQGGGWMTLKKNGQPYKLYCALVTKKADEHVQAAENIPGDQTLPAPVASKKETMEQTLRAAGISKADSLLVTEGRVAASDLQSAKPSKEEYVQKGLLDTGAVRLPVEKEHGHGVESQFSAAVDRKFIVAVGFYI